MSARNTTVVEKFVKLKSKQNLFKYRDMDYERTVFKDPFDMSYFSASALELI